MLKVGINTHKKTDLRSPLEKLIFSAILSMLGNLRALLLLKNMINISNEKRKVSEIVITNSFNGF